MSTKPQTVNGFVVYLRTLCTGTGTTGCDCRTCRLAVDVTFWAGQRELRLAARRAADAITLGSEVES